MANNQHGINTIKIMSWNSQSILNKIPETHNHLEVNDIDVALFTETWLTPQKHIHIPNYTTYRLDRSDGLHGGVAISIKQNIRHSLLKSFNTKIIEAIGISINDGNQVVNLICCYFPGTNLNADSLNQFKKDIRTLTTSTQSFFLIGDFNAKHRLWNNFKANAAGQVLYNEMCNRNFTIHHPQTPSYFPPQRRATHPSTIDIVITNNFHNISPIITTNTLTSDHLPIEFNIDIRNIQKTKHKQIYRYDRADWTKFKQFLNNKIQLDEIPLNNTTDIDFKINFLTKSIHEAIEVAIPKTSIQDKNTQFSSHLQGLISDRNRTRRQWQRNRDPNLKSILNYLNREIHKESFYMRNKVFSSKIEKLEPGSNSFWKTTKMLKSKLNRTSPLRDKVTNQLLLTDSGKMVLQMNLLNRTQSQPLCQMLLL